MTHFNSQNTSKDNKDKKISDIVAIGCTDDSIKFIDYSNGIVYKYVGLKNYPSCFCNDV